MRQDDAQIPCHINMRKFRHCEGGAVSPEAISFLEQDCFAAKEQERRLAMTGVTQ